jgi:HSP20 family molecular chaperone IbpA
VATIDREERHAMAEILIQAADETVPGKKHLAPAVVGFKLTETEAMMALTGNVGGFDRDDIQVLLDGDRLTVSGYHDQDQDEDPDDQEWDLAAGDGEIDATRLGFTRSWSLPTGVTAKNVEAELYDGVLEIVIDKNPGRRFA